MRNKYAVIIGLMVALGMVACCNRIPIPPDVIQPEWIVGGDLSLLDCNLAAGAVYKDSNGKDIEVMSFFKEKGMNYARIRLFVNPDLQSALARTCRMCRRPFSEPKPKDTTFCLIFIIQIPGPIPVSNSPAAWEKLNSADLANRMYTYTRDVLVTLVNTVPLRHDPDWERGVQRLLWDSARVSDGTGSGIRKDAGCIFANCFTSVQGLPGSMSASLIMIHSDRGGDRDAAVRFFRHMEQGKVDYISSA